MKSLTLKSRIHTYIRRLRSRRRVLCTRCIHRTIIALLVLIMMTAGVLPLTAQAEWSDDSGWYWHPNGGKYRDVDAKRLVNRGHSLAHMTIDGFFDEVNFALGTSLSKAVYENDPSGYSVIDDGLLGYWTWEDAEWSGRYNWEDFDSKIPPTVDDDGGWNSVKHEWKDKDNDPNREGNVGTWVVWQDENRKFLGVWQIAGAEWSDEDSAWTGGSPYYVWRGEPDYSVGAWEGGGLKWYGFDTREPVDIRSIILKGELVYGNDIEDGISLEEALAISLPATPAEADMVSVRVFGKDEDGIDVNGFYMWQGKWNYDVISNSDTWLGSGDFEWKIDAPYNKFKSLQLNGSTVDGRNYAVTDGSTVITFKESYIKTLSDGNHTFRAEFNDGYDGYAELTLTIESPTSPPAPTPTPTPTITPDSSSDFDDVPKTGDDSMTVPKTGIESNYIFWICVCTAALGLSVVILLKLRKTTARR